MSQAISESVPLSKVNSTSESQSHTESNTGSNSESASTGVSELSTEVKDTKQKRGSQVLPKTGEKTHHYQWHLEIWQLQQVLPFLPNVRKTKKK